MVLLSRTSTCVHWNCRPWGLSVRVVTLSLDCEVSININRAPNSRGLDARIRCGGSSTVQVGVTMYSISDVWVSRSVGGGESVYVVTAVVTGQQGLSHTTSTPLLAGHGLWPTDRMLNRSTSASRPFFCARFARMVSGRSRSR